MPSMTVDAGTTAYVGLGSNLGRRRETLRRALEMLEEAGAAVSAVSSFYRTEPRDMEGPWFLNAAARLEVPWDARGLLRVCEEIERRLGRTGKGRLAPRTADLDILLYGQERHDGTGLAIPHPRMAERRFVLVPLAEIGASVEVPGTGATVGELLESCTDPSSVLPLEEGG